jgi:periplasmic protein TonB
MQSRTLAALGMSFFGHIALVAGVVSFGNGDMKPEVPTFKVISVSLDFASLEQADEPSEPATAEKSESAGGSPMARLAPSKSIPVPNPDQRAIQKKVVPEKKLEKKPDRILASPSPTPEKNPATTVEGSALQERMPKSAEVSGSLEPNKSQATRANPNKSSSGGSETKVGAPVLVSQADYLKNPHPKYPEEARRKRYEGKIVLAVKISTSGSVSKVSLHKASKHQVLNEQALATVKTWRFSPTTYEGKALASSVLVPITFKLAT